MNKIRLKRVVPKRRLTVGTQTPLSGQLPVARHPAVLGRRGFGLNEVLGIAAAIIIAAVVVIPGLQSFAGSLITNLETWWNSMSSTLFAAPG